MKKVLFILAALLLIVSCTPYRYLDKHHNEICMNCVKEFISNLDTSKQVQTITHVDSIPVINPLDPMVLNMYFKCDSTNKVVLDSIDELNAGIKKWMYLFKNGKLTLSMLQDSILYWKKQYIIEKTINQKEPIIIKEPAEIKYKIPTSMWFLTGGLLLSLIIILVIVFKKPKI